MVLAVEAVKMLQAKYPDKRIISGMDMTDFYAFQMWDRKIKPDSLLGFPTGSTMTAVRKRDGEEFLWHMFANPGIGEYVGDLDVLQYLNHEDAMFAKSVLRMLNEQHD